MNHPSDAYQVFCAHAQILGASGRQLARWIDVPWLDRGDLFYLHKLAETVKAYRGVRWQGKSGGGATKGQPRRPVAGGTR